MTGCGPSDREEHLRDISTPRGEAAKLSNSIEQDLRALIDILDDQLLEQWLPPASLQMARAMAQRAHGLAEHLAAAQPRRSEEL